MAPLKKLAGHFEGGTEIQDGHYNFQNMWHSQGDILVCIQCKSVQYIFRFENCMGKNEDFCHGVGLWKDYIYV